MKLSVGIITKNEELNLPRTLDAIKNIADEIIIVDSGSTDNTESIAQSFGAKFYDEEWKGYGKQKNSVLDKCKGDWILLIDADEVVSDKLSLQIENIINGDHKYDVYKLNRCSICFGKEIKYGGWSNEYIERLWKNGAVKVSESDVHETYITKHGTGKLKGKLLHYTYSSLEAYFNTFNRYTSLMSVNYHKRSKRSKIVQFTIKPGFAFFKMYILKLGFLDGIEGLLLARLASIYVMTKYYKLKELNTK